MTGIIAIRLPNLQFLITGKDGSTHHITAKELDRIEGAGSAKKLCNYPLVRTYTAANFDREPDAEEYNITGMGLVSIILGTLLKHPERNTPVKFNCLFDQDYSQARDWFERVGVQVIRQEPSKTDGFDRAAYHAAMQKLHDDFARITAG